MRSSAYKRRSAGAILFIVFLLVTGASATTYQVGTDLQAAIDAAAPGDTLIVSPDIVSPDSYGKIVITKNLDLVGNGAVIRASSREACVEVRANNVNISGFVVRDGFYGIKLDHARGCLISNNTVVHCVQPGITLVYSDENVIEDNVASFNGLGEEGWYGIYLSSSNRNRIENNTANDNGEYGICLFPSCRDNVIKGNVAERNDYGIYMFTDCSGNLIESNRLVHNRNSGLKMIHGCVENRILNNTISDNDVVGISLYEGSGSNLVRGNEIAGNTWFGIQIQEGPGNNTIVQNNVSGSQKGIYLDTDGNIIYNNRFFENVIQALDRGTNKWYAYPRGGNFWGDYQGQDLMGGTDQNVSGSDGFGDEPYWINEYARDRYPIMGRSVLPLKMVERTIIPARARIGEQVKVRVTLESKYGVAQVSARAHNVVDLSERSRYVSMNRAGVDVYEGTLETALMNAGRYEVVLTAKDIKGNKFEEPIGEVELLPRSGWSID